MLFALHWELLLSNSKTVNTWKISGMLIVYWPITIKFRIRMQSSKPQTNYRCCLLFSYLLLAYFLQHNNIPWIFLVFMVLWVSHSNIIILLLLYHQTGRTGTPEIFLACYCVAIKRPIRRDKTKPQARMLISLFFSVACSHVLIFAVIVWHNKHSWNISSFHGYPSRTIILHPCMSLPTTLFVDTVHYFSVTNITKWLPVMVLDLNALTEK